MNCALALPYSLSAPAYSMREFFFGIILKKGNWNNLICPLSLYQEMKNMLKYIFQNNLYLDPKDE